MRGAASKRRERGRRTEGRRGPPTTQSTLSPRALPPTLSLSAAWPAAVLGGAMSDDLFERVPRARCSARPVLRLLARSIPSPDQTLCFLARSLSSFPCERSREANDHFAVFSMDEVSLN